MKKKYIKTCPICKGKQTYTHKGSLDHAIKNNSLCLPCYRSGEMKPETQKKIGLVHKGKKFSKETRLKMSKASIGKKVSLETRFKMGESNKGKRRTDEFRERMRIGSLGRKPSNETRKKMSDSRLKIVAALKKEGYRTHKTFSKKGCFVIDAYGKANGYNFQHAMNGGEVSVSIYHVDGYDKERNTVIEYDEVAHNNKSKIKKDSIRQDRIVNILECDFIRISPEENK